MPRVVRPVRGPRGSAPGRAVCACVSRVERRCLPPVSPTSTVQPSLFLAARSPLRARLHPLSLLSSVRQPCLPLRRSTRGRRSLTSSLRPPARRPRRSRATRRSRVPVSPPRARSTPCRRLLASLQQHIRSRRQPPSAHPHPPCCRQTSCRRRNGRVRWSLRRRAAPSTRSGFLRPRPPSSPASRCSKRSVRPAQQLALISCRHAGLTARSLLSARLLPSRVSGTGTFGRVLLVRVRSPSTAPSAPHPIFAPASSASSSSSPSLSSPASAVPGPSSAAAHASNGGSPSSSPTTLSPQSMPHFALKVLAKAEIVRLKQVEHIQSERGILGRVKHPFIVELCVPARSPESLCSCSPS